MQELPIEAILQFPGPLHLADGDLEGFFATDQRRLSGGQRQLGRLQDGSGRECGLMTAAPALIALVAPAMDQPVFLALTAGATETIRPACLLQGCFTFLLGAVELDELRQRQACLKLDSIHGHGKHIWYRRTSLGRNGLLTELAA
jgi:hypothetical protein